MKDQDDFPPTSIRNLLFDAGGVLLTIDYELLSTEAASLSATSRSPSASDFEKAERFARPVLDAYLATTGTEDSDGRRRYLQETWNRAWEICLARESGRRLLQGAERFEARKPREPAFRNWAKRIEALHRKFNIWRKANEGAQQALERLVSSGSYRLAVVSNSDGRVEALLEEAGLAGHFELIVDSHHEGIEKPDPGIFRRALRRLGAEARESVYLGDFYSIDVLGARRAGLTAVLMDPEWIWNGFDVPRVRSMTEYADLALSGASRFAGFLATGRSTWKDTEARPETRR